MQVLDNTKRTVAELPGIVHLTVAGGEQGLKRLSVWRQTMAPGCATPAHQHDCEEAVLVVAGSGEVHIDGQVLAFGPDSTLVLPPGVPHQIFNTGDGPLVTVAAFSATPVGTFQQNGERLELPWKS
jgi:quercetin dioxygenase-like cupin family protein